MRYLILGGGGVTAEYYLPALRLMGRLADATVVDPDAASIRSLHAFGAAEFHAQDYAGFLKGLAPPQEGERSGVIVALPNHLHVDAVRLALEQGRHVLCEKPLALTAADCARLRELAAAKRRVLKVGMSRRYLPSLMLARDIVKAGELGELRAVEVHDCMPFGWRPRSFAFFSPKAGGILADLGVHYLDYVETLAGALQPLAYADDARGGIESSLEYRLEAGHVKIEMRLSRLHRSGHYLKIACERGEIHIDKAIENEVVVVAAGALSRRISAERPFDDPSWPKNFHGSFCQMLADFDRAIDGHVTPIADASAAERAAALIEWAYEGRRTVSAQATAAAPSSDRIKVLVTGGTGFIGGHLVERLSRGANDIRVAARTPATCANVSRFPVGIRQTDLLDRQSVRAAVSGMRTVFHLAYGTDRANAARITIEGTKNVVEAAIAAGVDCVMVLSTMYVFGFPNAAVPVDESFPYRPYGGEYGRSKAIMERWCLTRAQSSLPTRIVVLNPTCVFGPAGGAYTTLPVDLARQGQFCWISGGVGLCNYTFVENLVDAIVAAARIEEAHGHRFIINDGATTWREFLEPMIRPFADAAIPSFTPDELKTLPRYGEPFRLSDLVAAGARAMASPDVRAAAKRSRAIRALASLTRRLRSARTGDTGAAAGTSVAHAGETFPPEWLADLYSPATTTFSAKKAHDVLHWRPSVDLAAGQRKTIDWLMEARPVVERGERT